MHAAAGEPDEAERLYCQATELLAESVGEASPDYAPTLGSYGQLLYSLGRFDEAQVRKAAMQVIDHRGGVRDLE